MTFPGPTPQRWIALLRAINVGGHTVKMSRLRELFTALGFGAVETLIASGNICFEAAIADAAVLEQQIEVHLRQALGYPVATFVRTPVQLAAIARSHPFAPVLLAAEAASLYIAFLPAAPSHDAWEQLMAFRSAVDELYLHDREIYWLCRTKTHESRFSGALLEKIVGMPATLRNVTTVGKLAAKYTAS